jgi:Lar family restriction alleviation protein
MKIKRCTVLKDVDTTYTSGTTGGSNSTLIDLLACPFCGKAAAEVVEDYKGSFIACCTFCGATSHRMYSRDAAANKWNRRSG